jgi:putative protein kinase ArgK-like GTPase of G3E family
MLRNSYLQFMVSRVVSLKKPCTRETPLRKAAGFDAIIAEMVAAEQSDTAMAEIIDMLLLLLPAGCR